MRHFLGYALLVLVVMGMTAVLVGRAGKLNDRHRGDR